MTSGGMQPGSGGSIPTKTLSHFRELPLLQRLKIGLCVSFAAFHIGVTLVRGASTALREPAIEHLGWYSEGLRLATTWGMFSKPPDPTDVVVMGVLEDNSRVELSHTDPQRRDWFGRITDVRLRKIQNKLSNPDDRSAWGEAYLAYFCRAGADRQRLKRVELELVKHPADATLETPSNPPQRESVQSLKCARRGKKERRR
jgi:hypothetical protein